MEDVVRQIKSAVQVAVSRILPLQHLLVENLVTLLVGFLKEVRILCIGFCPLTDIARWMLSRRISVCHEWVHPSSRSRSDCSNVWYGFISLPGITGQWVLFVRSRLCDQLMLQNGYFDFHIHRDSNNDGRKSQPTYAYNHYYFFYCSRSTRSDGDSER